MSRLASGRAAGKTKMAEDVPDDVANEARMREGRENVVHLQG